MGFFDFLSSGQKNVDLTANRAGYVDPAALNSYIAEQLKRTNSPLLNMKLKDGAEYGIPNGTAEEWGKYLTSLSGRESSFNRFTTGDHGKSIGLFQTSTTDAAVYGLNGGKPFTQEQLNDPKTQVDIVIRIHERLVGKHNSIRHGAGKYYGPIQRGWHPEKSQGLESARAEKPKADKPKTEGAPKKDAKTAETHTERRHPKEKPDFKAAARTTTRRRPGAKRDTQAPRREQGPRRSYGKNYRTMDKQRPQAASQRPVASASHPHQSPHQQPERPVAPAAHSGGWRRPAHGLAL